MPPRSGTASSARLGGELQVRDAPGATGIQTAAAESFETHPLPFYYTYGLRCTINTDNRLVTSTTVSRELLLCHQNYGFTLDDVKEVLIAGFKSAFLPFHIKQAYLRRVTQELERFHPDVSVVMFGEFPNEAVQLDGRWTMPCQPEYLDIWRARLDEVVDETRADPSLVHELEEYGVIRGESRGGVKYYDETEREIVRAVTELARYGVGGRNLRAFRTSADREAALLQQILAPALRSRNTERRKEALEALENLAAVTTHLKHLLLVRDLRKIAS